MDNEKTHSCSDVLKEPPIFKKCYDSDKHITYDEILIHMYEGMAQKYLYKVYDNIALLSMEEEIYNILKSVINNNIDVYIKIEVYLKSHIRGSISVKYIDVNTKKEVMLEELYKYTPTNLDLIKNGSVPINKAI